SGIRARVVDQPANAPTSAPRASCGARLRSDRGYSADRDGSGEQARAPPKGVRRTCPLCRPEAKGPGTAGDFDVQVRQAVISDRPVTAEEWIERYGEKRFGEARGSAEVKVKAHLNEFAADLLSALIFSPCGPGAGRVADWA